jgi:hypothetical protein
MKYNTTEIKQYMAEHKVSRSTAVRHLYPKKAPKLAPVVDVKQKAANDKPEPKVDANVARAAGLKLFNTAGRPKKSDFIKVFGKMGPAWTWETRAKAVGMSSAEECAASFQSLLKRAGR